MRIALILSQTPGYSETFFNSKIQGLCKQGVEVLLFCQTKTPDLSLCPVVESPKVVRNPVLQLWYFIKEFSLLLPYLPTVFRYIKLERKEGTGTFQLFKKLYLNAHLLKARVDWLHFGFATQALGSETVGAAIGAKMAVSFRGFDMAVYPVKHPGCYRTLWKYVDKVHSISNDLYKKAISFGLSEEIPFAIITPAVQLENLPLSSDLNKNSTIKIVTIARLTWIKGLDIAIAAMDKLKKKGIVFNYYIIGEGDSNYTERYKFMVYELGLQKEVVFCGKLSHRETLQFLAGADLYVQPSLNEGFCNAVLEAQAMGIRCVVSNAGGLPENVLDGKTGWVVPKYSPEALAEKMEQVLAMEPEQKKTITQNAQKRVSKDFSIQKQQKEFLEFYQ